MVSVHGVFDLSKYVVNTSTTAAPSEPPCPLLAPRPLPGLLSTISGSHTEEVYLTWLRYRAKERWRSGQTVTAKLTLAEATERRSSGHEERRAINNSRRKSGSNQGCSAELPVSAVESIWTSLRCYKKGAARSWLFLVNPHHIQMSDDVGEREDASQKNWCDYGKATQFNCGRQRVLPGSSQSNLHAMEAAREEVRVSLGHATKPNHPNHLNFTSVSIFGHSIALSFQNATTGWCSGMPRCTRFERTDPTITSRSHSQHTPFTWPSFCSCAAEPFYSLKLLVVRGESIS